MTHLQAKAIAAAILTTAKDTDTDTDNPTLVAVTAGVLFSNTVFETVQLLLEEYAQIEGDTMRQHPELVPTAKAKIEAYSVAATLVQTTLQSVIIETLTSVYDS